MIPQPLLRLELLEVGALLTAALVWQSTRSRNARMTYLLVVLISAGTAIASELLSDSSQQAWPRALLLTSACVKLGAVPMIFWLLSLADELPVLVLGLIIAVVDIAAFGEFCVGTTLLNSALSPQPLWIWTAALTALVSALLMLTQRSLKRLLVLSTIEDIGFLLLGLSSVQWIGIDGALIAAATHSLAKALLFACLAAPESAGELAGNPIALASRYPVSAFGFLFGMLAMLGVPPTMGFLGRWRIYETAYSVGICPLVVFIASSVLALIAYTLALTHTWWGPPADASAKPRKEPFIIQAVIVLLVALLLGAGLWPQVLTKIAEVRP